MLPIQCNQHPWMHMYLNVVDNPFYAVTGPDGHFESKASRPASTPSPPSTSNWASKQ